MKLAPVLKRLGTTDCQSQGFKQGLKGQSMDYLDSGPSGPSIQGRHPHLPPGGPQRSLLSPASQSSELASRMPLRTMTSITALEEKTEVQRGPPKGLSASVLSRSAVRQGWEWGHLAQREPCPEGQR